jgi:glycosyltransferase involved in cell wall biosynthesis
VRVALDAQLAVGTATGIGEYVSGLRAALPAEGIDVVSLSAASLDPWRFDRRVIWDQVLLPLAARRAGADLLHCASGTMPLVRTMPAVVTVHDVAWLRVQEHARAYARYYFGTFAMSQYRRARRLMVDSAFSRGELIALCPVDPSLVDVVYPGVAQDVAALVRRPDAEPFVLVAGTVERRKNLAVVIRALADLAGVRVIAVGPQTDYRATCERIAVESAVADRVEFRGYLPREELLDLYARAAVAAVPSTYEGFGYGAAWALCAGVPLVASNSSSLPEVVGSGGTLVKSTDVASWREAFARLLADRGAAEAAAAAARPDSIHRFSWRTAAEAVARTYASALAVSR